MLPIEPLGLSAKQWQFLSKPDNYVRASNIKANNNLGRSLDPTSTPRQFKTARDILARFNGSCGEQARRGILLADDVGLGKTTVAALVAWVVASAGEKRKVRILVPNDVMKRRWVDELKSHVALLKACAPTLDVRENCVKDKKVLRLSAGAINVVKHSYAGAKSNLSCDLLIIDEAHRAKGENSTFSKELKRQNKNAKRILILTATPFSIRLEELQRMLTLIGGEAAHAPVRAYSRALDDLYSGNTARSPEVVAERLVAKAKAAVDALSVCVIRHGVDDLPQEKNAFGDRADWNIDVPPANPGEIELMLRMDRALRMAKGSGAASLKATNDPRFHVGWRQFDAERANLKRETATLTEPAAAVVKQHLKSIEVLRSRTAVHSKMVAVADVVLKTIAQGEKVLLFCHHHATAQELTAHIDSVLPKSAASRALGRDVWEQAWRELITPSIDDDHRGAHLNTFIDWLCADMIREQTWGWFRTKPLSKTSLIAALRENKGRNPAGNESIFDAAQRLYGAMVKSTSIRAVLKRAVSHSGELLLPGSNGTSRVLGVCHPGTNTSENKLFIHNNQPDTVISIFNSPFGPDVLVATDKLSEGVDLHRYCRHLIHYELDPSPIRTVQRNGRLRRVDNWAAVTKKPILFAYPAFQGTRDHRLVQIMKKRIDSFSLLLGGVQDIDVDEVVGSDETWRNDVIAKAKRALSVAGGQLRAR